MTKPLEFGTYEIKGIMEVHSSAITTILQYLYDKGYDSYRFENEILPLIGTSWVEGRGTWPKRVARKLKALKITMANDHLAMIGKIARESCITGDDYLLHVVNKFDWNGDYGDSGSCYWNSKRDAKRMIVNAGGGALLLHKPDESKIARCWWVPWEKHLILFNGYTISGDNMSLTSFSRMVMDLTERTYYRKISLSNRGMSDGLLWINSSMGFLVGDQSIQDVVQVELKLLPYCYECGETFEEEEHVDDYRTYCPDCAEGDCRKARLRCYECDDDIDEENSYYSEHTHQYYCESCYDEFFVYCGSCGEDHWRREGHIVDGEWYCNNCFNNQFVRCDECGLVVGKDEMGDCPHFKFYCESCREKLFKVCDQCGYEEWKEDTHYDEDGESYCYNCTRIHFTRCHQCRMLAKKTDIYTMAWGDVCCECVVEEVA
jgi:hypothetical protein